MEQAAPPQQLKVTAEHEGMNSNSSCLDTPFTQGQTEATHGETGGSFQRLVGGELAKLAAHDQSVNSSPKLQETTQGFMKRKLHRVLKMLVGRLPSLLKSVACLSIGLLTRNII